MPSSASAFVPAAPDRNPENEALVQRLKSALHLPLGQLIDTTTLELNINASPQFIGSLTELAYAQIETVAQDLEAFAQHRRSKRIEVKDVLLLGRRNEGLKKLLEEEVGRIEKRKENGAKGKGKVNQKVQQEEEEEEEEEEVGDRGKGGGRKGNRKSSGRVKGKGGRRRARASGLLDDEAEPEADDDGSQAEEDDEMEVEYDEEDDVE